MATPNYAYPQRIVTRAPGRSCLFGDHQDYLKLPVIACAIDRHIRLEATANNTGFLSLRMPDVGERREINLDQLPDRAADHDYLMAALLIVGRQSAPFSRGYDVEFRGNIPINAGTSSSSAVLVAWVHFLLAAYDNQSPATAERVAGLAYEAEVAYFGAPGGKMDQYSIGLGRIMYLETGDELIYELFDYDLPGLIIAESGVPKDTTGVLGELKTKALAAVASVKEQNPSFDLRRATPADIDRYGEGLPEDLRTYFTAAILNYDVTRRALREFRSGTVDPAKIGQLMTEHHRILADYLDITVPRIDDMVAGALKAGALGAKIVGSGRGGSVAILARAGEEEKVITAVLAAGAKAAYPVAVDPGASLELVE